MALPSRMRLRRGLDITGVVRGGRRARSGGLVVHCAERTPEGTGPGPRIAFVASRTVGNAVVRNRTRRRLQASLAALAGAGALTADVDLVVRLLPSAADVGHDDLDGQLRSALGRLGVLDRAPV